MINKSLAALAGSVVLLTLAACGNEAATGGGAIPVEATDSACSVSTTTAKTGTVTFEVNNKGTQVTEFYFYAAGDRTIGEVENIAPGLTRQLTVQVPAAGTYQTACKPGMAGEGIRGDFQVTG